MKNVLNLAQLEVESFPTVPADVESAALTGSTDYCCDTRYHCSTLCREPTNVCYICA